MTVVAAILAVGYPVLFWLALRYVQQRDQSARLERAVLLQRIQAPEQAVAEHVAATGPDRPAVSAFDDDDYWQAQQEALERMEKLAPLIEGTG